MISEVKLEYLNNKINQLNHYKCTNVHVASPCGTLSMWGSFKQLPT